MKKKDKLLHSLLTDFVVGLLRHANITHAGNCHAMCRILKPYLSVFYNVETLMCNCKVMQGRNRVNHYYLVRVKDGVIIDATASQFKAPDGSRMPQVFIGKKPDWYA